MPLWGLKLIIPGLLIGSIVLFQSCKNHDAAFVNDQSQRQNRIDNDFLTACRQGDLEQVKKCLSRGAAIRARSNYRSALFSAMDGGSLEVMKFLVEKEKELVFIPDEYGVMPLGYLVRGQGNFKPGSEKTLLLAALNLLIGAGANVNENDDYGYGLTEIFFVSGRFAPDVAEILITRGALVNHKSLAAYPDSFCDVDFTLPPGSTPLDKCEALLEVVPADNDFANFRNSIIGVIRVLKKHGAVNGAWAVHKH
jgi:ankyrin repeat protein